MKDKNEPIEPAGKIIDQIIVTILQPAIAGGITDKEAENIFNQIMESISSFKDPDTIFESVLDDVLYKICFPYAIKSGFSRPIDNSNRLN